MPARSGHAEAAWRARAAQEKRQKPAAKPPTCALEQERAGAVFKWRANSAAPVGGRAGKVELMTTAS